MISIDLSGKIALVTGSSQGIGQACASVLARAGACVALAARNEENLTETASEIIAAGGRAEVMAGDLTLAAGPSASSKKPAPAWVGLIFSSTPRA